MLPLNARSSLVRSMTNQVGKAWDKTLAATWEIEETLLENFVRSQILAIPVVVASTSMPQVDEVNQTPQGAFPLATHVNKKTHMPLENTPHQQTVRLMQ